MSEESISLYDLLNLSIGSPQKGAVNFIALHALLHAVLKQLDIRELKTRWRQSPPGDVVGVTAVTRDLHPEEEQQVHGDISAVEQEAQPGTELQEWVASPSSPTPSSDTVSPWKLRSRIQSCEDGVSEVMKLVQELHKQKDHLQEEMKELQHKTFEAQPETIITVEKCCHRVDALEEAVRSLRDTFQTYPDPEELSQCVTWDVVQSALLSERENLQKELVHSGVVDAGSVIRPTFTPFSTFTASSHTSTSSSPRPVEDTGSSAAPHPPSFPGQASTLQEGTDALLVTEAPSVPPSVPPSVFLSVPPSIPPSGPPQLARPKTGLKAAGAPLTRKGSGSERYPETVEALRDVGKLKERFNKMEARVAALEEEKVDQSQLRELVTNRGSPEALNDLMDQLKQHQVLIERLMSEREKMDSLENMFMNLMSQDRESSSEAASGSVDSDSKASHQLRQQITFLRMSVQKLEEDMKQLKVKQVLTDERATDRHLQDQLDDLRGMLEDMMLSLTSELSISLQDESDGPGLAQGEEGSAFTPSSVNIGRGLSRLLQHYEQLQDTVNKLLQQPSGGRAGTLKDRESVELENDVQNSILQLQAECEKLDETTRRLHEDNRRKQTHIEELYKTTEELGEKKADKLMVESEIKADKFALDSKVSRLQFDSMTEQLNALFHELLNKVTGQEQDWHRVMDRLSTEMECKLNRIELDSVKKQLEDRWKKIHEKLQAQGAPEHEDAAGLRKQLVDRFHCLSCDRPVVKYTPGPQSVKLASTPGFPSHRSIRPFTVYALEQFRQHYRRLKPGTNRYNYEVANSGRRSHALMCRQIDSVQRLLKHCDTACSHDATSDSLSQNQPPIVHERIAELTDCSHLTVTRSCGGSHTVTSASQRRLQNTKHVTEADAIVQSEEVDIVGLDGQIYRGRLNASANKNTDTKLPTISTKDGKTKDKAKSSLSHKPAASPEVGHGAPAHPPHIARSVQCSRSASSSSGRDWPVSALGCTSQSSMTQAADETLNL